MDSVFGAIAAAAIGLLFAVSCVHKLRHLRDFTASVRDYRLLWPGLHRPVAWALLLTEAAVVITLVQPGTRPAGALLAIFLLLLYAAGIGINLARGRTAIDCGCSWGARHQVIKRSHVFRNMCLAVVSGVILIPANGRVFLWMDWVSVIGGTLILVLVYWTLDTLSSFQVGVK
ncbi:MAG: MauE/DoxX family redox-associated membrane protein [bacterium]